MRLLVSVRSAAEVAVAVAGGADIVDAKEPARGSLGAVDAMALGAIAKALPDWMPLSVALGDLHDPADGASALTSLEGITRRPRELYVKVGLAGIGEAAAARAVLGAVVDAARAAPLRPAVVAVGYADHDLARALPRDVVSRLAAEAGASGVLLDTWRKDGRDMFAWAGPPEIQHWLELSRRQGLVTALAGSLSVDGVREAARLRPEIIGVRGAACDGGRSGVVNEARVRRLATAIAGGDLRSEAVA
jgi:(5-formylfuran-3-yl)methyl phosphate synthase